MGREVRMVPPDWQHPKDRITGRYLPQRYGQNLAALTAEWDADNKRWENGWRPDYISDEFRHLSYAEYSGNRPNPDDYMPAFAEGTATHYMMYEDTSEGTPISPAFATPEELARWLVDNKASSFGTNSTAPYEAWLNIAKGGYAPSMIYSPETGIVDGVTASLMLTEEPKP